MNIQNKACVSDHRSVIIHFGKPSLTDFKYYIFSSDWNQHYHFSVTKPLTNRVNRRVYIHHLSAQCGGVIIIRRILQRFCFINVNNLILLLDHVQTSTILTCRIPSAHIGCNNAARRLHVFSCIRINQSICSEQLRGINMFWEKTLRNLFRN